LLIGLRHGTTVVYQSGQEERIPASEMIHIYHREFIQQTRGISPLNACLADLKQLDDYQVSELMAAKMAACMALFYERNGQEPLGNFMGAPDEEDNGSFIQELSPGIASIVPNGFSVKSVAPTHPNTNFDAFTQSVLKRIGASLGISENQLCKDYAHVNFSSLREGANDSKAFFEDTQEFLIDNWKELQYKLFLESLILKTDALKPDQVKQALRQHNFICAKRAWYDPSRDILATKYALELGVKNPLQVIDENGADPNEILDGWSLWKQMCEERSLAFNDNPKSDVVIDPIEEKTDEEQMAEEGRKN
jgi:lambda family phage portal protein